MQSKCRPVRDLRKDLIQWAEVLVLPHLTSESAMHFGLLGMSDAELGQEVSISVDLSICNLRLRLFRSLFHQVIYHRALLLFGKRTQHRDQFLMTGDGALRNVFVRIPSQ